MKAIQFREPGHLQQIDVEEPSAPGPGEALVAVRCVAICGTDMSGYRGVMPFFSYPRIPGHELGVEVLAVICVIAQFMAVLNSLDEFAVPALSPILLNLLWLMTMSGFAFVSILIANRSEERRDE